MVESLPADLGDIGNSYSFGKIPWRVKWKPTPVFLPGNPTDRGAWLARVHGVTKSQTQLSDSAHMHRLSSCGAQAELLFGMWNLPRPGINPMSPALASGFLSTMPPGKSKLLLLLLLLLLF